MCPQNKKKRAASILFDLDGTLVDSAPDLADALNHVLQEAGRSPLPFEQIRPHVGRGAGGMVKLGFGLEIDDPTAKPLQQALVAYYRAHLNQKTVFFDGMEAVLDALDARHIPWGIVTNKIASLTEPLLEKMGIFARAHCVVSGDTTPECKPSPQPLLHACKLAGMRPDNTIYLGDDIRDMQAANAAGMIALVARWGYLHEGVDLNGWPADGVLTQAQAVYEWLALE